MADFGPQLARQMREIESLVVQVSQNVDRVGTEVVAVGTAQQRAHDDLRQLRAEFVAFTEASERRAAVQLAETKIGQLQDKIEHTFGHHKVVRRTATGLLQAFDSGLVSDDTVRTVSEQLMIQTPRYWLAPALVALSAWSADEPALCERAVAEAYRRSPAKTSLLFTLVLRRQQRLDTSARWLAHYLRAQDPAALGRDFAVILEAVALGAFGPAGRAIVDETRAAWADALADSDTVQMQVSRWRFEVEDLRELPQDRDFPSLAAISPDWPTLKGALGAAEGHELLLSKYEAIMAEPTPFRDRIEDAMDDILDRLVTEYDNEELPLRRELAYNEAVAERNGDVVAAKAESDAFAAVFEETQDYLTIQTFSALDPSAIGVSKATQKIAIAFCRPWFAEAHDQATRAYRQHLPSDVGVKFDGNHNVGAAVFRLPEWQGRLSTGLPELEKSLSAHWDANSANFIASLGYPVAKKLVVPAVVTVAAAVIGFLINSVLGLVVTVALAGIYGFVINRDYQKCLKNQQEARRLLATWKDESLRQLRAASAELTDWGSRFQDADQKADDVRTFITSLETATHGATPYERRPVQISGAQ